MPVSVLFVDDSEDLRAVMNEALARLHVRVVLAGSLDEVMSLSTEVAQCALAIIDINLGDAAPSGIDVAHWLESTAFHGPIVFLTGHGQSDPRVKAAVSVANAELLTKPIPLERIERLIDAVRKDAA